MTPGVNLTSRRVLVDDDIAAVYEYLDERGLTDGLPVIPPSQERVAAMVGGAGMGPEAVVAVLPPDRAEVTVEKVAVNAVMAGCRPEYMPVLIAAIQAIVVPAFNPDSVQVTTHPATPMLILNGPIRAALDVNGGSNAMGQGWRANATIGRALRLVLVNLGGATPGGVDRSTQGQPGKFTFCFGENEEDSPWEPLHVERGFGQVESAVTPIAAAGTNHIVNGSSDAEDLLASLTYGILTPASNNVILPMGEPVLLLCPDHAQLLAGAGYTKATLKQHLFERARVPAGWISEYIWARREQIGRSVDRTASVPMAEEWDKIILAVVGGPGGLHSTFVPSLGSSQAQTQRIGTPKNGAWEGAP